MKYQNWRLMSLPCGLENLFKDDDVMPMTKRKLHPFSDYEGKKKMTQARKLPFGFDSPVLCCF